jgi:hypothetical protein
MKCLMTLVGLALLLIPGTVYAQTDESKLPPTDYGAGYKIVIFHQIQEHPPGAGDDQSNQGPIKLDTTYPLVASPLTREAKAFNTKMRQVVAKWWNGPQDNSTASDPDTDYSLDCEPVGLAPPVDSKLPSDLQMVPGVISVACGNYSYGLGAAHGGGENWGFNWLVHQEREVRASDIFDMKTDWLRALTAAAEADRRSTGAQHYADLDFSDTSHWVVTAGGLGLTYSWAEFGGFEDGGAGMYDSISWSKLATFLRKDGIVPQADWSATTPSIKDLDQ